MCMRSTSTGTRTRSVYAYNYLEGKHLTADQQDRYPCKHSGDVHFIIDTTYVCTPVSRPNEHVHCVYQY